MPSVLTHPAVPLAIGLGLGRVRVPPSLLFVGVVVSIVPDADVIAFGAGIAYEHVLGHRGFTHSLAFAVALAGAITLVHRPGAVPRHRAFLFLALSAASHGILDAFTNGGLGIALLWPLTEARYFAPVRVIAVSPIGISRFLSDTGARVLWSEMQWVWLPALALFAMVKATTGPRALRERRPRV